MSSPGQIPFNSFINLNRKDQTSIYVQLAQQIIQAIQRGFIPVGTKLPGSRQLAQALSIHRNTVVAAFQELEAQGWIAIKANIGSYVLKNTSKAKKNSEPIDLSFQNQYAVHTGYDFEKSTILEDPFESNTCSLKLDDGIPDSRLSPLQQLSKFYTANLKRKKNAKYLGYTHQGRPATFREQLCNFLNQSRGLHIQPKNLLITRSVELSIFVITQTLLQPNDLVIVGQPSYFATNMIFQQAGAKIKSIPVDEEGISIEALEQICQTQNIRLLYLTPHHHYPTTVTLSPQRRSAVLELASKYGFAILEDDYDYDFHYDQAPLMPMAAVDYQGMVIYTGSFGKSLAPGFRTGFIVAPENLIAELQKLLNLLDHQGDFVMEQVLSDLIEEGEIHRYLKKSSKLYQERRNYMSYLLARDLHEYVDFHIPDGGLALWTNWKKEINLIQLSKECAKANLFLPKTILYQAKDISAIRIGFGSLNQSEMEKSVEIIVKSLAILKQ
ncbi:PLP-dependent aminotransferase family protein [Sphingobacterium sp. SRCM116780]|uniref:aminotransferase-like domain-containing protein n=1 Tax=Sphingobacterium sp. SRCM116780 TaxID=2907623 RepID=UPI001F1A32B8|nr:PLP-dependent aminotransferase family protein [Sphingobacterium sp. SRCM116780]UIR57719.1 PLP-dependent aminotransferase family protein [Sphingobacterium sp. SRCM116780]